MAGAAAQAPKTTPPEEAAEIIVRAVEKGTYRVFIGNDARSLRPTSGCIAALTPL